jgi:hypothetical protein
MLFFNRPPSCYDGFKPIDLPPAEGSKEQLDAWKKHQKLVKDLVFPAVAERIYAEQFRQRERFSKSHMMTDKPIAIGTMVMVWDQVRSSKNEPPYVGPYEVKAVNADKSYTIADLAGGLYHRNVVMDQMKVLTHAVMSESDRHQWYVDHILAHRYIKKSGSYEFKVRWIGFDSSHDEWVKQKDFGDEQIWQDYFRSKSVLHKHKPKNSRPLDLTNYYADAVDDVVEKGMDEDAVEAIELCDVDRAAGRRRKDSCLVDDEERLPIDVEHEKPQIDDSVQDMASSRKTKKRKPNIISNDYLPSEFTGAVESFADSAGVSVRPSLRGSTRIRRTTFKQDLRMLDDLDVQ